MSPRKFLLTGLWLCLLLINGCENSNDSRPSVTSPADQQTPPEAVKVLTAPLEARLFESPSEALPVWRAHRDLKPALVLYSNDPFLLPMLTPLKDQALDLIKHGTTAEIAAQSAAYAPDPTLGPQSAVNAALQAGFFSQLVWVMPSLASPEQLSLKIFRQQLIDSGVLREEEAQAFQRQENTFIGSLGSTPVRVVLPSDLPQIDGPTLIHIDPSYFKPLYKNEISTPLFPIIYATLNEIRRAGWQVLTVSLSQSNLTGLNPLEVRFLGPVLAALFYDPPLLDAPLPINWIRQRNILYMANLFQSEKILETAQQLAQDAGSEPAVQFALYQAYRQANEGDHALLALDRAVALDRVYGLEYLNLVPLALKKGRPDEALRMLRQAKTTFPDNPFITLKLAAALLESGQRDQGNSLIHELREIHWSPLYYPQFPERLQQLQDTANAETVPKTSAKNQAKDKSDD